MKKIMLNIVRYVSFSHTNMSYLDRVGPPTEIT